MQSAYIADGDSITNQDGTGGGGNPANRFPDQALAQMGLYSSYNINTGQTPQILYFDTAIGGRTCQDRITNGPILVDPFMNSHRKYNIVSFQCGLNDYAGGITNPNTVYASILTYVAARKAAGAGFVIVLTMEDAQVFTPNSTFQTFRSTLNGLIRAGAVANGYTVMDIAADATMGCDGCASNTTYFRDGEHPTAAGYTIFANYLNPILTTIGLN